MRRAFAGAGRGSHRLPPESDRRPPLSRSGESPLFRSGRRAVDARNLGGHNGMGTRRRMRDGHSARPFAIGVFWLISGASRNYRPPRRLRPAAAGGVLGSLRDWGARPCLGPVLISGASPTWRKIGELSVHFATNYVFRGKMRTPIGVARPDSVGWRICLRASIAGRFLLTPHPY